MVEFYVQNVLKFEKKKKLNLIFVLNNVCNKMSILLLLLLLLLSFVYKINLKKIYNII